MSREVFVLFGRIDLSGFKAVTDGLSKLDKMVNKSYKRKKGRKKKGCKGCVITQFY
jgi:hypothetical protein